MGRLDARFNASERYKGDKIAKMAERNDLERESTTTAHVRP